MRCLRFGEIPKNNKSVNFCKLTFEQNESFTWFLKSGETDRAFEELPETAFEAGVSVFEIGEDEMPVLNNLRLCSSLAQRLSERAFVVEGEQVGIGNDGEPLVSVQSVESFDISEKVLINHILDVLKANFRTKEYEGPDRNKQPRLSTFYHEWKVNRKTGEKVEVWEPAKGKLWDRVEEQEVTFAGWAFSDPIEGFDTQLGVRR